MQHITLAKSGEAIALHVSFKEKEIAKSIPGRVWSKDSKCWEYPLCEETFSMLKMAFPAARLEPDITKAISAKVLREAMAVQAKVDGWENAEAKKPMPLKTKPFAHQVLGYNIGIDLPNVGLLMEQGCGKSLTAVAIMGRRFLDGEIKKVLVVAPSSVVPVWAGEVAGELAVHADFPYHSKALTGPVQKRIEVLESWVPNPDLLQVAATNYESAWRMEDALKEWGPDMIICDESQRIKTPGARQSKALHRLGRATKYRLILTGTPVTQSPLDFYSQYLFLDPNIFGRSFFSFRARYAVMGGYGRHQVVAYKNLPELIEKAHRVAFRVTKEEALDLPEFTDQVLYCEMEPKAQKLYDQMRKDSVMEIGGESKVTAVNVLARLLRLSQLTGGFVNDPETGEPIMISEAKISLLKEAVDDLMGAGKKVVIFARFVPEIKAICQYLEKSGIGFSVISGATPMSERGDVVQRFQQDSEVKVFVAQIQTAGLGITLTAADTAIFYSLDYSFANYEQARARIHRLGQKNACTYLHLVCQGTVDEKIMEALKKKKSVADEVVDGWRELLT